MKRSQNSELGLDDAGLAFYRENGYLHIEKLIDPWELERLDTEAMAVIDYAREGVSGNHNQYHYHMDATTGRMVLSRIGGMATKGGAFFHLYGHPRILAIAEAVLGRNFMPLRDALQIKMPEYGAPVPWHRIPATRAPCPPSTSTCTWTPPHPTTDASM